MLHALTEDHFPTAAALLAEGFPERSRAFWAHGLGRLAHHAGNGSCGVPLGALWVSDGEPVGVALTPASPRTRPDGSPRPVVNLSSWYVRPQHRWRAPLMLRALLRDPRATYVDLTPSPPVEKMLLASGFRAVGTGTTLAALPVCAVGRARGARVRPLAAGDRLGCAVPPPAVLQAHRELGCLPLVMEHEGGPTLFVCRPRAVRGLRAVRLEYVGSHQALQRHLPALARHLLARGFLCATWDTRDGAPPRAGTSQRDWGRWYARGEIENDCTDFIGTELCLLGV
jgi:hypothetical protein